jgi:DNA-binding winged helix-turn-helix (wHTH) protein
VIFTFEDFELDAQRLELRRGGELVEADTLVLRLLLVLVTNAGSLVTKEQLVEQIWDGRAIADNAITIAVTRLRKALGMKRGVGEMVTTVYGRGYRFVAKVRERSSPPTLDAHSAVGDVRSVLVGREGALATLQSAWAEAQRGHGRLCALLGEAGIGKTYVAEVFLRSLPRSACVLWAFCREAGDTPPLSLWSRVLRALLARPEHAELAREAATGGAAQLLREASLESTPQTMGEEFLDVSGRHRIFEAVSQLLAQAAERAPLLIVLEDLHRADGASLALLGFLLDEIAQRGVVIVTSARPVDAPTQPSVRASFGHVLGHRNCERISLDRLSEREVHAFVVRVLGPAQEQLARAVYAKSEGNPFFMAELCRQLRDQGPGPGGILAVPQPALELVRRHVQRLDEDALGVLSAACVLGRSFELWLLRAITGREASALMECLDAARAAEVVVAAPDSATGFAFGHEMYRVVLYDALSPAERRRRHAQVANALLARARDKEFVAPSDLAFHLHAALPESDPKLTVHYCRLAAASAATSFSNADVIRCVRRALEALDLTEQPSTRLRMHLIYLLAMYARGDSAPDYESATYQLAQLARAAEDGKMLVRAAIMYNLHPGFRQLKGAGEEMSHALGLLQKEDIPMRAVALSGLAMSAPTCFSGRDVAALLDEALPLARASGSRAARYVALIAALQLRGGPAHAASTEAVLDELSVLALQNQARMPVLPIDLSLYRAVRAFSSGDLTTATRFVAAASGHARQLNHAELLWHSERMGILANVNRGEQLAQAGVLARLQAQAEQPGLYGVSAFAAFDQATWMSELGGSRPKLTETQRSALAYDISDPPSLWSLKLRALVSLGAKDEARAALFALRPAELAGLPSDRDLLGTLGHVIRAALKVGALDHAAQAAARLSAHPEGFAVHVGFLCEGAVPHLLGSVSLALGESERAVSELQEGLAQNERAGFTLCAAYARLELARALQERGRSSDRARARSLRWEVQVHAERHGLHRLGRAATALRVELRR